MPQPSRLLRKMLHAVAILAFLSSTAFAQAPATDVPDGPEPTFHSADLPDPDLSSLEPAVAEQLRTLRSSLAETLGQGTTTAERVAELFGELGRHYHAYRLDDAAESCYATAESFAPTERRWPYYRGILSEQRGRLEDAVGPLARALSVDPEYVAGLVRLGEVYRQLGRSDESSLLFSIALRVSPRSPAALAGLGELALAQGRHADAVALLSAALEQQPQANRLRQPLAMAYRGLGDLEKAREQLEQRGTVGVRPPDPLLDEIDAARTGERAHILRGRMAYGAGRFAEAAELFQQAVDAQPASTTALVNLSAALARLGRLADAEAALRSALEIDPDSGTAHYNLGQLLVARNDLSAAIEELSAAASRLSEDASVQLDLARLLRRVGRTEDALPYLALSARLDPSSKEVWLAGGDAMAELGRYREARAVLEQGFAQLPDDDRLEAGLARLLASVPDASERDGERALTLALHAYQVLPSASRAETVAMALGELGRCSEAAAWQETAIGAARVAGDEARAAALAATLPRYQVGAPCRPPILSPLPAAGG